MENIKEWLSYEHFTLFMIQNITLIKISFTFCSTIFININDLSVIKFLKIFNYSLIIHIKIFPSQMLVAQACNLSYSEGRNQEDHSLKSAWANSL
jgi:hypothetical protein